LDYTLLRAGYFPRCAVLFVKINKVIYGVQFVFDERFNKR